MYLEEQDILESLKKMKFEGILSKLPENHELAERYRDFSRRFAEVQAQAALQAAFLKDYLEG